MQALLLCVILVLPLVRTPTAFAGVNPTAWGPPRPLQTAEAIRAVRAYAAALARFTEQTTDKLSILGLATRQPTASGDVG